MKRLFIFICISAIVVACDVVNDTLNTANDVLGGTTTTGNGLSNEDVIAGLKEALTVGTSNSSASASKADGFWKNEAIKLAFPPDAIKVKQKAEELGLKSQVEKFELTLNRAAEEASKEAKPIFISAVKNMTIADGWNILKGDTNAATMYLKKNTSNQLYTSFKPKVTDAIAKVQLTKYWNPIITKYNQVMTLTGGEKLNPDLEDYVTKKAMDGLFHLIAIEEGKIRQDPLARVSDILQKVFSTLDK